LPSQWLAACVRHARPRARGGSARPRRRSGDRGGPGQRRTGIHKIRHVVVIMQENRSFDNYFGTFPGADGIPMRHGKPIACLPDPLLKHCVRPHHDPHDVDLGQWHSLWSYTDDYDKGRMDGFARTGAICLTPAGSPPCRPNPHTSIEAMGYHDQREIPNYWAYAKKFVLQDHMFEPAISWSLPAHLYLVSEWSALCTVQGDPLSCHTNVNGPAFPPDFGPPPHVPANYAWTDLTWLLHRHNVSWGYYVKKGPEPDCENANAYCGYKDQQPQTPASGTRCRTSPTSTRTTS
jgi:phospholipase C